MVQIISGNKGKGKTKHLLDKANAAIKEANGSIVYLDKSSKHMYELSNKIRLINVKGFDISDCSGFIGFICGIISQDHDLEVVFLDSFLKVACLTPETMEPVVQKLKVISEAFHVDFMLSVSMSKDELPESLAECVMVAL